MKLAIFITLLMCSSLAAQNIINPYRFAAAGSGGGEPTGVQRITEEGDGRNTEEGDSRIIEEDVINMRITEENDFRVTEEGDDRRTE